MKHSICENIKQISAEIKNTQLVVVSKYRSLKELQEVYDCGNRDFGENRVQELVEKYEKMPKDIKWHAIGHLQTNKVKYIASFVHLVHAVDSLKLLRKLNQEAEKNNRVIDFLFQLHVAQEESKYGIPPVQFNSLLENKEILEFKNVRCRGIMGMATNTDKVSVVRNEFKELYSIYTEHQQIQHWDILSMGMSGDYKIAIEEGSTTIRVGSKIFNVD
jgi:pyridoxal phosphate enzyme (YggS family)